MACDVLVLGAGLTGLAAAAVLGDRAVVLERDERPGGLVRTERFGDYVFDRVIHLLHFRDPDTEARIRELLGATLAPCPPDAFVECSAGTARFPIQNHLHGLSITARLACLRDLAAGDSAHAGPPPRNYREFLLQSFGRSLCGLFFFPYNRKMWRRPLESLVPADFQWNIARPRLDEMVRGAFFASYRASAYNSNGWYPRPSPGAEIRGMEVMPRALSERANDLRLGHDVIEVDVDRHRVLTRSPRGLRRYVYRDACLSTIPLPVLVERCPQVPRALRTACARLSWNRVASVALSIRGPRPRGLGHWRYFTDESLAFTRLVFLHEFDPLLAPPDGWPLLAEIPQRAEDPLEDPGRLAARIEAEVSRCGVLPRGARVVDAHVMIADPAYVVFTEEAGETLEHIRAFFAERGVTLLGRYGRWEYSSMAQALRDGFAFGAAQAAREMCLAAAIR